MFLDHDSNAPAHIALIPVIFFMNLDGTIIVYQGTNNEGSDEIGGTIFVSRGIA